MRHPSIRLLKYAAEKDGRYSLLSSPLHYHSINLHSIHLYLFKLLFLLHPYTFIINPLTLHFIPPSFIMGRVSVTESMPNFTGQFIDDGRLQLLESRGAGAYGKVYRALDHYSPEDNQVYYAVKCLYKPEPGSRQEEFQIREFALHKIVREHPNIVTIHKVVSDELFVYVILDLCSGGDLFAAITENRVYHNNDDLVKESFIQLLDAVHSCHEQGVFHRDIKPENVLCSKNGSDIRLADFGLSTTNRISKDLGCGSAYYMSPGDLLPFSFHPAVVDVSHPCTECIGTEINVGVYSTRHTDIWSLGVILTNMITGRNPWRYATTEDECFAAYLHDNDFLHQVLPISDGANAIIKRIFVLNPLCRISLPELRNEIIKLDTFFRSDDDLASPSAFVRDTAVTYATSAHIDKKGDDTLDDSSSGSEESVRSIDPEEVYIFDSPIAHGPIPDNEPIHVSLDVRSLDIGNFVIGESSSSGEPSGDSSSEGESDGPITPATYPTDPEIEVPDLPEGEGIDQSAVYLGTISIKTQGQSPARRDNVLAKPPSRRARLFRMAVQRLKALSSRSRSS